MLVVTQHVAVVRSPWPGVAGSCGRSCSTGAGAATPCADTHVTEEVFAEVAASWRLQAHLEGDARYAQPRMAAGDACVATELRRRRDGRSGPPTAGLDIKDLARRVAAEIEAGLTFVRYTSGERRWHIAASCALDLPVQLWKTRCVLHSRR